MKPTRDQLANRLRYATTQQVGAFYGTHPSTVTKWMIEYELTAQEIPLEDKLLMIELYYKEGMRPRELYTKFKEEITILNMSILHGILKPKPKGTNTTSKTYEEARDYHIQVAKEKE